MDYFAYKGSPELRPIEIRILQSFRLFGQFELNSNFKTETMKKKIDLQNHKS
jgi:hypothetical protein